MKVQPICKDVFRYVLFHGCYCYLFSILWHIQLVDHVRHTVGICLNANGLHTANNPIAANNKTSESRSSESPRLSIARPPPNADTASPKRAAE